MFERFSDRARRVIVLAQEEARMLDHNYIGTEHILLALIREGDGVAAHVLRDSGVDFNRARQQVIEMLRSRRAEDAPPPSGPPPPAAEWRSREPAGFVRRAVGRDRAAAQAIPCWLSGLRSGLSGRAGS